MLEINDPRRIVNLKEKTTSMNKRKETTANWNMEVKYNNKE